MASILGNEWHISSSGNEFLTESGSIQDKQQLYNFALNTDLKEICSPVLNGLSNDLTSKVVLQIHKIRNISAPKANEESQAAPRMLKLTLTDGENYIQAIELSTIGTISLKNTPPGTKVLIQGAKLSSGFLLLNSQNCKVLGGKVASLIEKWEFTKNVQRNRRNYNEDGPPPWVNFGVKIQTGNQGDNLKSLTNKPKDMPKENSEFEQQRQDAIAEASSGAVKKIFSGRVKQNVQVQNATNRRNPEKSKEKKEPIKGKGKPIKEKGEIDDKPQKPSEKVSLFDFLEDKLPVTSKEDTFYNNQPYRSNFKDTESSVEDQNKYDYKRKKMPIPKQFEKPETKRGQNSIKQNDNNVKQNFTDMQSNKIDNSHQHRQNANIGSSFTKQRQSNFNSNSANFSTNNQYQNQQINRMPLQGNSFHSLPPNYQVNAFQFNQPPPANNPSSAVNNFQYNQQPIQNQNLNFNSNNFQYNQQIQNSNNFNKRPYQKQNVQNDVNHITRETQKMTLNSQFASRSLRQHLNLGAPSPRRNDEIPRKVEDNGPCWNIGDEVLAKYWEDGKFYNATIISITDKTFAVRFKGYGNIEEILKTDCLPIMQNSYRPNNNPNQQYDKNNKQYSGSVEFRRSSKNYK